MDFVGSQNTLAGTKRSNSNEASGNQAISDSIKSSPRFRTGRESDGKWHQNTWAKSCHTGKIICISLLLLAFVYLLLTSLSEFPATVLGLSPWTKSGLTAIFLVTNEESSAVESVGSFLKHHQCDRVIIATHAALGEKASTQLSNVQVVIEKRPQYDLYFVDTLLSQVATPYFFLATTEWEYHDGSLVDFSLQVLRQFPTVSQVLPNLEAKQFVPLNSKHKGFSFLPGVHSKNHHLLAKEGFASAAKGATTFKEGEERISQFYISKGIYVLPSPTNFNITRVKSSNSAEIMKNFQKNFYPRRQNHNDNSVGDGVKIIKPKPSQPPTQPQPQPQPVPQPQQKPPQNKGNTAKISSYLSQLQSSLRQPIKFYQVEKLKKMMELPICLVVVSSQKYPEQSLLSSIKKQSYQNYVVVSAQQHSASRDGSTGLSYWDYRTKIEEGCQQNALIMFVAAPLAEDALSYVNQNMQTYEAWVAYSRDKGYVAVVAFYYRIYELLGTNDFRKTNDEFLAANNPEGQTLGMLQLCLDTSIQIEKSRVISGEQNPYFSISRLSQKSYSRSPYTKLLRLSQDMEVNLGVFQRSKGGIGSLRPTPVMEMTVDKMFRAAERENEWYLPDNHTIMQLQYEQYSQMFKINELESKQRQVHFCVTILSHNNIQNNRHIKVMKSIVMQKYENYHIVFIDDNSSDNNMNGTIDYMSSIGFPRDRIVYIQNLDRKYATYNIINAAFNYCGRDHVQMLMDGDDQFIGRYAFQVMNAIYQSKPDIWVVYSNYKTNYYGWGRSRAMNSEFDHAANGRRSYISLFGAIRSWRVQLVYGIPLKYHQEEDGKWLDTVYDDALGHCLFEMSSVPRIKYVSEILYQYNIRYGDNDDSTSQKIKHRGDAYRYVISLPTLKKLDTLDGQLKDPAVDLALKNDQGVKYKVRNDV